MQSSREKQGEIRRPFFNEHCKEVEENNRMGKTRDLFKKIRDTKGTFHGQRWYGPNKSRSIKKRWQEYTEELHKKDLHDPDNHSGVITHLEPDVIEC